MKTRHFLLLALAAMLLSSCNQVPSSYTPKNAADSASYYLGLFNGLNYSMQYGYAPETKAYMAGFKAGCQLTEEDVKKRDAEFRKISQEISPFMQEKMTQKREEANKKAEAKKVENQAYLDEHKTKPGVNATTSGLQYEVLTMGNGAIPKDGDKVKVNYHGTLLDGTVFDSSVDRGEPAEFGVNQVIKGWTEALKMMPVGSKWRLTIPSDLAYGTRGSGPIGANEILVFEVELLEIVK